MGCQMATHNALTGPEVRAARRAARLTLEQLAVRSRTSVSTLVRIESGMVKPRQATLLALQLALNDESPAGQRDSVTTSGAQDASSDDRTAAD